MHAGFTAAAVAFFTELEADNSRSFWLAQRHGYDAVLRPTFLELTAALGGTWRVYRPHNDTRFGNATPYKAFLGAVTERPDGIGAFLQIGPRGLLVGTGIPMPAPDQLARWRTAVGEDTGADLGPAVAEVEAAGARVHAGRYPPLARTPLGWPADHPRSHWLRWKGVEVTHRPGTPDWLDTPHATTEIETLVSVGEPLHRWLGRHVGPSALSPQERFARR